MATLLPDGLFTTPSEIRGQRIDQLMQQSEQRKQMSLLNQVAAGRGAQLAESVAGLFGLKSPEEAQAEKMQALVSNVENMNDPKQLMALARQLSKSNPRAAMAMFTRARELEMENKVESRAAAEEERRAGLYPLQLEQTRTGIATNQTSNSRNIQAMNFAADAEAERLAKLSREKQQRELESQVVPENGENLGSYYMRVGRRAQELGLGDVAQSYFDKANQARNSRYDYQRESRYNPTTGVTETQWIRIEKATGKMEYIDGPPPTASNTETNVKAEPPARIDLTPKAGGGVSPALTEIFDKANKQLPLPELTPQSTQVIPYLEEYSRKLNIPAPRLMELWQKYLAYAQSVQGKSSLGMYRGNVPTFREWITKTQQAR